MPEKSGETMLEFKKMTLESAPEVLPYLKMSQNRLCDNTLGGTLMWRDAYDVSYAVDDGALYIKMRLSDGRTAFALPLGKSAEETVPRLSEYAEKTGERLIFATLSNEEKNQLLKMFPEAVAVFDRDYSDYIYLREDLAFFAGKKYSGQRNHINRFLKEQDDWSFEEIGEDNIPEVRAFFDEYNKESGKDAPSAVAERTGVYDVLANFSVYGFFGEALRVGGRIIGFFLCEALYDTLFVHIEKCRRDVGGAYQMLARREAEKYCTGELKYINREDDSGDEGLRRSKLSYHPFCIAEKYIVEV